MIPIVNPFEMHSRIIRMNTSMKQDDYPISFGTPTHNYSPLPRNFKISLDLEMNDDKEMRKLLDIINKADGLPLYRTTGFCVFNLDQAKKAFATIRDSKEVLDKIICLSEESGRYKICRDITEADLFYHEIF